MGQPEWIINISNSSPVYLSAILDFLQMTRHISSLFGLELPPKRLLISSQSRTWTIANGVVAEEHSPQHEQKADATIALEFDRSPWHKVESAEADILLRSTCLPVRHATQFSFLDGRTRVRTDSTAEQVKPHLRFFLQTIFRKREFRELQADAILTSLKGRDTLVLLPTGAGKSIIYQLAGLLLPGATIVVDPIVALIEDQLLGLRQHGIDRATGIQTSLTNEPERNRLLKQFARGEYLFILVAPERLQSARFRQALRTFAQSSLVNLTVVDEAHCVSEWGHDFRPAYLNLGRNLRNQCRAVDGSEPPLLALTGTASRVVLRDVLTELDIDRNRPDALIRTDSFDRPELKFSISRTETKAQSNAAFGGIFTSLPQRLGVPLNSFFSAAGRNTTSGIVFTPFVNGSSGVVSARDSIRRLTGANAAIYAGSCPDGFRHSDWEEQKRNNAKSFKNNEAPVLVATKAFGMGIDKPNIRYTVHLGMPGSIESFYQETGRAGRDGRQSQCCVVFTEHDTQRSDFLLDPAITLEELRRRHEAINRSSASGDDVTNALWFHLKSFDGVSKELINLDRTIRELGDLRQRHQVKLPFWSDTDKSKGQERALYRLVRIGILEDYEVEFGSRHFAAYVRSFDQSICTKSLLDYIKAAQPAKAKVYLGRLENVSEGISPSQYANELARILVEFTYDVVERSRRRMLQEAILLARSCTKDDDVRKRLLDYLHEGLGSEMVLGLAEAPDIDLGTWVELLEEFCSPMEAGEIRGIAIRALESYPDHPGLLLVRSVAELLASGGQVRVAVEGIATALGASAAAYDVDPEMVEDCLSALLDFVDQRSEQLKGAIALSLVELATQGGSRWRSIRDRLLVDSRLECAETQSLDLAVRLDDLSLSVVSLGDTISRRYGN